MKKFKARASWKGHKEKGNPRVAACEPLNSRGEGGVGQALLAGGNRKMRSGSKRGGSLSPLDEKATVYDAVSTLGRKKISWWMKLWITEKVFGPILEH